MSIIDEIKDKTDLIALVNESSSVKLRRSGRAWTGFCPYHENKRTPALVVWQDSQTWHCFGCNEGGTVIDWVMRRDNVSIQEAVRRLAERANIPLRVDEKEMKQRLAVRVQEETYKVAMGIFQKWLWEDEKALAYVRGRGLTDETIRASGIGFSGRGTAAKKEMADTFAMYGIDPDSPQAVTILGYWGDVGSWARAHGIDPSSFREDRIHGMMDAPGIVFPHRIGGRIRYVTRRQLPGHDVIERDDGEQQPWKSFNPYTALAGERMTFFNHLAGRVDERIVIVEGQMDAITLGQWGIPAMAMCGAQWKNLGETIEALKKGYDAIYFASDADAAGERIVTGKDFDFPLAAVFGPMLWIVRWPRVEWSDPNDGVRHVKDANDLLQYFRGTGVTGDAERDAVEAVFAQAKPIVMEIAEMAGLAVGPKREKLLAVAVPLIAAMPRNARNDWRMRLAKALYPEDKFPELGRSPLRAFNKLVGDEVKEGAKDDEGNPAEIEETVGGWYPVNDEGEGYLVDMVFDRKTMKGKLVYAHIFPDGRREIDSCNFLDINGKRLVPMVDDNIRYGTVVLPSELGQLRETRDLLSRIEFFIKRYFLLDNPLHYKFGALYALFTWVYDSFDQLLYLRARGGPGTGKSELMLRLGLVCYRMMITSGVSSLAGFKGLAHLYKGTLFIDEVDNLLKEDKGEMRALLNVRAMKKQARVVTMMEVVRADGTHGFSPATTYVYGPTLMTMYGAFKDPGTESRCLTFDLMEKEAIELAQAGIEPGYIPPEMESEALALRNDLMRWRLQHWMPSLELTPEQRKQYQLMDPMVSARVNQIMRPLKVLAVQQNDKKLLDDLFALGRANYEDEVTRRAGTFEALIFRAVVAADEREEYQKYVHAGTLGSLGMCRYILYKDLALVANEIIDAENISAGMTASDKDRVKSNTIGTICRDAFRLPVHRTGMGWAVVLDRKKINIVKLRFGMSEGSGQLSVNSEQSVVISNQLSVDSKQEEWKF